MEALAKYRETIRLYQHYGVELADLAKTPLMD
jgi:hypothetical protein